MSKHCIIHIGVHKTGSTAIQQALFENRSGLLEEGFFFPAHSSNYSTELRSLFGKRPERYLPNVKRGYDSPEKILRANNEYRSLLVAEFMACSSPVFVLSAEGLSALDTEGVNNFLQFIYAFFSSVKVIAYIREPVAWSLSALSQAVKSGKILDALLENPVYIDYRRKIEPWSQALASSDLELYSYDKVVQEPYGLLGHFFGRCGIQPGFFQSLCGLRVNTSLSSLAILSLSALNECRPLVVDGKLSELRRADDWRYFAALGGPSYSLHGNAMIRVLEKSAKSVEWLKKNVNFDMPEPLVKYNRVVGYDAAILRALGLKLGDLALEGMPVEQVGSVFSGLAFRTSGQKENISELIDALEEL